MKNADGRIHKESKGLEIMKRIDKTRKETEKKEKTNKSEDLA